MSQSIAFEKLQKESAVIVIMRHFHQPLWKRKVYSIRVGPLQVDNQAKPFAGAPDTGLCGRNLQPRHRCQCTYLHVTFSSEANQYADTYAIINETKEHSATMIGSTPCGCGPNAVRPPVDSAIRR